MGVPGQVRVDLDCKACSTLCGSTCTFTVVGQASRGFEPMLWTHGLNPWVERMGLVAFLKGMAWERTWGQYLGAAPPGAALPGPGRALGACILEAYFEGIP